MAEVMVLYGTNDGKGIDPSIGDGTKLKQPPFSSHDSYRLLERSNMTLPAGSKSTLDLPEGGTLELTLTDVSADKRRFELRTGIMKPDGKTFMPPMRVNTRDGNVFFLAGPKHKKGILVLGIRVRPKK